MNFKDLYPVGPDFPSLARIVLNNLITNSRDAFADRDGNKCITITARRTPEGLIELIFEDNAGGIAPVHLDRIFEPFFTTKDGQAGTGLGLSLSRKIISDHGGTIECRSAEGRTRFTLLFPGVRGPDASIRTVH